MSHIPHKPVVREAAKSTKMRIVFDASAKAERTSPSLNDCLETGPPLQNLLWSVLARNPFKTVAFCGDLKRAFLQVRILEADRDALHFHWYVDDVISGTDTVDQGCRLKEVAISVFGEAGFKLHKWHSNVEKLEAEDVLKGEGQTYAKEQLGVKPNEAKLLGLPWNKREDTLAVSFKGDSARTTKREVLKSSASV